MKKLKIVVPKGRIFDKLVTLINDAGYGVEPNGRGLKPKTADRDIEVKIMKPQNIPPLLALGSHDVGFSGYDWKIETDSDIEEIMDLGFDPVRIVAAVPTSMSSEDLKTRKIVVASEYEKITTDYLKREGFKYQFLRVHGATEVFPPDDADMIVDNTSTGTTLRENNLRIVEDVLTSSTRFFANKSALEDPWKKEKIEEMKMLFESVLSARKRIMIEMNIPEKNKNDIIQNLPCMKSPTISKLYGENGYAVKVVVLKTDAAKLIPQLLKLGATDILEYELNKVII